MSEASRLTLQEIRDALPKRKRLVLFFHEDDHEPVVEACRRLREEGFEVAEKHHRWMESGRVIAVDADFLQPLALGALVAEPSPSSRPSIQMTKHQEQP